MTHPTRLFCALSLVLVGASVGCNQHHAFSPKGGTDAGLNCETNKAAGFTRPVDVLFVVDNSGSMREEQAALRAQIPRLMTAFASGDINADGVAEHPPINDLHVGVISTDMGLPDVSGRDVLGCGDESVRHGDDGALLTRGGQPYVGGAGGFGAVGGSGGSGGADDGVEGCEPWAQQERFIRWQREDSNDDAGDLKGLAAAADDFACLASLGTRGCGFEHHLESTLKALWPSDSRVNGRAVSLKPAFLDGTTGQGAPAGLNTGFLRNEPGNESVIVVVMLTDEDDCSSHTMDHFIPETFLPAGDPNKTVGLNLRCFNEGVRVGGEVARDEGEANLYAVSRYVDALKALRPGQADLVQFVLVAGVPVDLIDRTINDQDATTIDNYYASLLSHAAMQDVVDPGSVDNPNLTPSCLRAVTGSEVQQKAYPPRRLVKVARGFGRNGAVESICQDDFFALTNTLLKRVFTTLERTSCVE